MYGFIRSSDYLTSERIHRSTRIGITAQLDLDWIEYLKAIGGPINLKPYGTFKPSLQLKMMVRRGIPVALRPLIWPFISRTDVYRRSYPVNYYESLLQRAVTELDEKVKEDIDKDLYRTFPGHDYFNTPEAISCLRRVLSAFAVKNEQIGYCQSLNFIAGAMILFMEEESAFWMMCHVIEGLLPADYYTKTMIGTYVDQFVLAYLIKTTMPKLHKLLQSFEMQLPLVAVEWFMCLFVNTLRPEVAFRVWDIFLNEGAKTLFRIAMSLLKRHEPQLLRATDAAMLFMTIKEIGIGIIDPDELMEIAYKTYRCPASTNYSTSKIKNILSPNGVGSANSIVLKRNPANLMKSVPRDLVGIGLAHLGPKALYSKFSAASGENGMTTYVMNVISGHRRPSMDIEDGEYNESVPTTGDEWNFASNTNIKECSEKMEILETAAPGVTTTVDPLEASVHALHMDMQARAIAPGSSRPRKKRDAYRNFGTPEINAWRDQFRPEVESRIISMENARTAYKLRRQILDRQDSFKQEEVKNIEAKLSACEVDCNVIENGIKAATADMEESATASAALPIYELEEDGLNDDEEDDGEDYDTIRRYSMSMSPDEKMHGAAPRLWNMLFSENGACRDNASGVISENYNSGAEDETQITYNHVGDQVTSLPSEENNINTNEGSVVNNLQKNAVETVN